MAQEAEEAIKQRPRGRKRRIARNAFRVVVALLVTAVLLVWFEREQIADDFIAREFESRNVRASYRIDSIAPGRQVLSDIVIGDPAGPDLTVERMEVFVTPRFGLPDVTEIRLLRPRIYGTLRGGQPSFGELDAFIFTGGDEPFEFPALRLAIDDGRGLLQSDAGEIGVKLSGEGHLRGGFAGTLAAIAPSLQLGGCAGENVTLYGDISIDAERPELHGPLRFDTLDCENGLAVRNAAIAMDVQAERNLVEYDGDLDFVASSVSAGAVQSALHGTGRFAWHDEELTVAYDVTARDASTPYADFGQLALTGRVRALDAFERIEVEGDVLGDELRMGPQLDAMIADAAQTSSGTMLEPLLNRLGLNLARELRGSRLEAAFTARKLAQGISLSVPEARLRGGSGATMLSLTRVLVTSRSDGPWRMAGNIATGGNGLPMLSGRVEQAGNGAMTMRFAMREYAAGTSRLALPSIIIEQGIDGRLSIEGQALASGPLPGGFVENLILPVDALVSPGGEFAMWSGCRNLRFSRLSMANLTLGRQTLTLCPQRGQPILRYGAAGLRIAAGTNALQLSGELAGTPIAIRSGPVGVAWPGALAARDLTIALGPADDAQRFVIADLRADLSADAIGGDFAGADVFLAQVPLDVLGAAGSWAYVDDRFVISDAAFTLEDRQRIDRFEPLNARGASLVLADSRITADALLRHPATDTLLSRVDIAHDLSTGSGHADLLVDGVTFGPNLQPAPPPSHCMATGEARRVPQGGLTCLALGVVSEVRGTVSGTGRIDWNDRGVTSSGRFSSDSLDLAAAFGPVKGASGTVVFTDLLGLTTAPEQRIAIRSVNPGIEVFDGEVSFQLVDGEVLALQGATWPFMGGTLTMQPVRLRFGEPEVRRYVMVIEGLQASQFVERMELGNVAASGTFDGNIPIVFDENGNGQLEGGYLRSRPPGGHVSYIGELTYEDMSFFANYAFQALRDLRYDSMEVAMNGPLTGELVTQVRFEGVGQGESAESNFVTRALADLPIELRLNIRAPFYKLMTSLRSLYDPATVRDPRDLGLVSDEGTRLLDAIDQRTVDEIEAAEEADAERRLREALDPDNNEVQTSESEMSP